MSVFARPDGERCLAATLRPAAVVCGLRVVGRLPPELPPLEPEPPDEEPEPEEPLEPAPPEEEPVPV